MSAFQLRDVPESVHRELKVRAARSGQSLSEYVLGVLTRHVSSPTLEEVAARVAGRAPVEPNRAVGDLIRDERDAQSA
jgi:plasmid stability protein